MNTKKVTVLFLLVSILFSILASSCGGKDANLDVAVIVALTQTAAALQQPAPTQTPVVVPTQNLVVLKGYQPFNTDECKALNDALSNAIGFTGVMILPVPFEDFYNKQSGLGCQITFSKTGQYIAGLDSLERPAISTMQELGWTEDMYYGSGGPGGIGFGFRKEDSLCLAHFEMREIDHSLCPGNEPISACWARLAPEQMKYTATFNCSTYYP